MTDAVLTSRETHILREVFEGHSNKVIGASLGITESTVKTHMKNLSSKLGANCRARAVVIALKRGILEI